MHVSQVADVCRRLFSQQPCIFFFSERHITLLLHCYYKFYGQEQPSSHNDLSPKWPPPEIVDLTASTNATLIRMLSLDERGCIEHMIGNNFFGGRWTVMNVEFPSEHLQKTTLNKPRRQLNIRYLRRHSQAFTPQWDTFISQQFEQFSSTRVVCVTTNIQPSSGAPPLIADHFMKRCVNS